MHQLLAHVGVDEYAEWIAEQHIDYAFSSKQGKKLSIYMDGRILVTSVVWDGELRKSTKVHIETRDINEAIDVYNLI